MVGAICKLDVLFHPIVTIQCFGWMVFFRAVFAGRNQTFLSLVAKARHDWRPSRPAPELIDECIQLERRILRVYTEFCGRYTRNEEVHELFGHLARQTLDYIAVLELCRAAAHRCLGRNGGVDRWRDTLAETDRRLKDAEATLAQRHSIADALRLAIEIESSQLDRVIVAVAEAVDPRLACSLRAFRNLAYLCQRVPVLEPAFSDACQAIRAGLPKEQRTDWN